MRSRPGGRGPAPGRFIDSDPDRNSLKIGFSACRIVVVSALFSARCPETGTLGRSGSLGSVVILGARPILETNPGIPKCSIRTCYVVMIGSARTGASGRPSTKPKSEDPTSRTVCASGRTNRTEQISAARTAYSARPQHRSSCDGQREGSSDGGIQIVV